MADELHSWSNCKHFLPERYYCVRGWEMNFTVLRFNCKHVLPHVQFWQTVITVYVCGRPNVWSNCSHDIIYVTWETRAKCNGCNFDNLWIFPPFDSKVVGASPWIGSCHTIGVIILVSGGQTYLCLIKPLY